MEQAARRSRLDTDKTVIVYGGDDLASRPHLVDSPLLGRAAMRGFSTAAGPPGRRPEDKHPRKRQNRPPPSQSWCTTIWCSPGKPRSWICSRTALHRSWMPAQPLNSAATARPRNATGRSRRHPPGMDRMPRSQDQEVQDGSGAAAALAGPQDRSEEARHYLLPVRRPGFGGCVHAGTDGGQRSEKLLPELGRMGQRPGYACCEAE